MNYVLKKKEENIENDLTLLNAQIFHFHSKKNYRVDLDPINTKKISKKFQT